MNDLFSPFSSSALASLPKNPLASRDRSTRADNIPDEPEVDALLGHSSGPHYDYHAINDTLPPRVRIPKKVATPIKVEAKVWFANERSELSIVISFPSGR